MIARAPGKVVLSGAYAVLEGAPALVAAVDRYVVADTEREANREVPEVAEALHRRAKPGAPPAERAPWFDASALRDENDRKVGLGSSAAILVASLAALELGGDPSLEDASLAARVFGPALVAHRAAQSGGSGIDVAASTFGGILLFHRDPEPRVTPFVLPSPLFIEVWASGRSSSTSEMLARVADLRGARPAAHRTVMERLIAAAKMAASASDGTAFLDACRAQREGLAELGMLSGAPIVTGDLEMLDHELREAGSLALPSGAGGGDIVLLMSTAPLGERVAPRARRLGFRPLSVSLGARGVHPVAAALPLENEVLP